MNIDSASPTTKKSRVSSSSMAVAKYATRKRRNKWLCAVAAVIVIVLIVVILAVTVFKTKRPVTTVNSVAIDDFDLSSDFLRMRVDINVTVKAAITVKNPNKVGFEYTNSSASLTYRGEEVGEAPIPAGKIGAGESLPMNITLTIMADRFLSNSQELFSDVISGTLPLSTSTRISGKVIIVNLFKVHVVSYTICNLNVSVSSRSLSSSDCIYKTKL